jgi:hypothetical protein
MLNNDIPNVLHAVRDEWFQVANEDTSHLWIVCVIPRPGAAEFFHDLEFTHYPPGTPANDLYEVYFTHWREFTWCITGVPLQDRAKVEQIAAARTMRLADGVPMLIRLNGDSPQIRTFANVRAFKVRTRAEIIDEFPLRSRRTWTLENKHKTAGPVATGMIIEGQGQDLSDFWTLMHGAAERTKARIRKDRAERN